MRLNEEKQIHRWLDRTLLVLFFAIILMFGYLLMNLFKQAQQVQLERDELKSFSKQQAMKLGEQVTTINKQAEHIEELKQSAKKSGALLVGSDFEVTWYNDSGITKSGRRTVNGVTAAVDPSVIPLGSWMRITMPDGAQLIRRADDTGGAVDGHVVDIYLSDTDAKLIKLGRSRGVKVEVLDGE